MYINGNTNDCILFFPAQGSCHWPRSCLLSALSVICPGRWRALSTAVVLLCPLLDLVSPLDWLVDLCLPCVPFVPLDFALFQPPAILALWTFRLVPCNELTALQGTCMSDLASTEAISALTEAIRDLTVALNPPAADSDSVSVGDWELLGEESEDFRVKLDTTCLEVKHRTIEEGPGPTPAYCEDLALRPPYRKNHPVPLLVAAELSLLDFLLGKRWTAKSLIHLRILFPDSRLFTGLFSSALPLTTLWHFTSRVDFGRAIEKGVDSSVFEPFRIPY